MKCQCSIKAELKFLLSLYYTLHLTSLKSGNCIFKSSISQRFNRRFHKDGNIQSETGNAVTV